MAPAFSHLLVSLLFFGLVAFLKTESPAGNGTLIVTEISLPAQNASQADISPVSSPAAANDSSSSPGSRSSLGYYLLSTNESAIYDNAYYARLLDYMARDVEESLRENNTVSGCIEYEPATDTYWTLKWADSFKVGGLGDVVPQQSCQLYTSHHSPCSTFENVKLHSGLLLLSAGNSPHGYHRYTGAQATLHQSHTFDRISIRAAFPRGAHLHGTLFASNWGTLYKKGTLKRLPPDAMAAFEKHLINGTSLLELIKTDIDYIEIASKVAPGTVRHGLEIEGRTDQELKREHLSSSLNAFHTYEMRWSESEARFSLDGLFSSPVAHSRRKTPYGVSFYLDVVGSDATVPESPQDAAWACPKMTIDYIRLYDRVSAKEATGLYRCQFPSDTPDSVLEEICPEESTSSSPEKCQNGPSLGLLAFIFLLALIGTLPVVLLVLVKLGFIVRRVPRVSASYRRSKPIIDGGDKDNTAAFSLDDF